MLAPKVQANGLSISKTARASVLVRCAPPSSDVKPATRSVESTISSLDALVPPPPKPVAPPKPVSAPKPVNSKLDEYLPSSSGSSAPVSSPSRASTQKYDFAGVMGFSGLAPEIINSRAAMIGFVAAIASEMGNGESVFAQFLGGGAGKAALVILAVTVASFAPIIRGKSMGEIFGKDKKPAEFGPFNANAEIINGRAAMIGLAAMLFLEGASTNAFFM